MEYCLLDTSFYSILNQYFKYISATAAQYFKM